MENMSCFFFPIGVIYMCALLGQGCDMEETDFDWTIITGDEDNQ